MGRRPLERNVRLVSAVEGVENTQAPKPCWMFGCCMTDSLCRGMPLMIVVLNSDTPAQPGKVRLWSTAAEGQAARMSFDGSEFDMLPPRFLNHCMRHWSFA